MCPDTSGSFSGTKGTKKGTTRRQNSNMHQNPETAGRDLTNSKERLSLESTGKVWFTHILILDFPPPE